MRKRQGITALVATVAAVTLLAGCASNATPQARPQQTQQEQQHDGTLPNRESAADESEPSGEHTPDHMGMPPPYEPQPLWPESGVVEFPHEVGDGFTGGTDVNVTTFFVSSVYTDNDYNLLSVRVADNFYGYNARDYSYSNLHYVDGVLCGGNGGSSESEIYSRTCWIIGTDGETWMTSYSADISYEDLAGYLRVVHDALVANAADIS
ncbi:MAG: hypothetical protein ACTJGQ_03130 [Agrococcus casei]|uniref:hypothetical protein n=1 Tax=Agrococcus casei TaxID=343512 RepID=UPI003F8F2F5A